MTRLLIDDPTDARLDDVRHLNRSDNRPDLPGGKGLIIAEGPLVVSRLVESRYPLRCIVGFESKLDAYDEEYGFPEGVPVYQVSREALAEVAGFDLHRGLVAAADRAEELSVAECLQGARTVCVLEGVGDHENIGALFRNAAGLDVDAILLGNGAADPLYRRSVRVSMGHVLRTPWARIEGSFTTWQRGLEQLKDAGFRLISMTPSGDVHLAEAMEGAHKVAILVGAEGPGLTEHAMKATDVRAKIPMAEGTDSLNVATSAAVAFYERQRQLR